MKKVFLMLFVVALAVCGCKDESYESGQYAGTYSGTFNIIKQSDNSTSSKQGKLHFAQNPVNKENMMWEYTIDMERTATGTFQTSENTFTSEMISAATSLIGISQYTDQTIDKILGKATFNGNTVTMKIYYKAVVLGVEADIVIANFEGTKEVK